jgi:N-carbamoylputrescine amidase
MTQEDRFQVGLIQLSCSPDPDANLQTAVQRVREAGRNGAQVICLPELFRTQYFCQREDTALFDLAETIPGPTTEAISKAALEIKAVVVTSVFEKRARGLYHNTAVLIGSDGAIKGLYRKMHIPDDPLYYEKYYFTPGDLGFKAFDTEVGRIGTLVCWDQWYPEGARLTALQGAQILFYPTAIGWHPAEKEQFGVAQHDAWRTIQRAHAIANGVFVAVVNRVGHETGNIRGNEAKGAGRSIRSRARRSFARSRRDPLYRGQPRRDRGNSPQLAVPARPPHRELLRDHASLPGLTPGLTTKDTKDYEGLPICHSNAFSLHPGRMCRVWNDNKEKLRVPLRG